MAIPAFCVCFAKSIKEMAKVKWEGDNIIQELKRGRTRGRKDTLLVKDHEEEESDERQLEVDSSIYCLTFLSTIKTVFAKYDLSAHTDQYLF